MHSSHRIAAQKVWLVQAPEPQDAPVAERYLIFLHTVPNNIVTRTNIEERLASVIAQERVRRGTDEYPGPRMLHRVKKIFDYSSIRLTSTSAGHEGGIGMGILHKVVLRGV